MRWRGLIKWGLLVLSALFAWWLLFGQQGDGSKFDLSGRTLQDELSEEMKELQARGGDLADEAFAAVSGTVMQGARYVGRDDGGRSWQVEAAEARQQGTALTLGGVSATASTSPDQGVHFNARQGAYNQGTQQLELTEDVRISGYGLELSTSALRSDLTTGVAASDATVTIKTQPGLEVGDAEIVAGQLDLIDNGEIIRLSNGVSATFNAKPKNSDNP